ncbi:MAG: VanW family protein [Deltaproteobacteria bacterium]|nr:VanW family protein [Deltaproteobacteria bacterium]
MLGPSHHIRFLISYRARRLCRSLKNMGMTSRFAKECCSRPLCFPVKELTTPIYRNLAGVNRTLFDNKKVNLQKAILQLDGVIIPPKKIFSFWHIVGPPVAKRGYVEGLTISRGKVSSDIGGGLCQISNALFWLALHSDLEVIERHRHSFDIFPDDHRSQPFGTGATVLYNYKDLRFYNPGPLSYQFVCNLTNDHLMVCLYASSTITHRYLVDQKDHRFINRHDGLFRSNTIVRQKQGPQEDILKNEILFKNFCRCQYHLTEVIT